MLLRCLKKMYKNKWIYAALTLGLILSIITIIVLPMFTRSSQDRLIRQALDDFQRSKKIYPLSIMYSYKNDKEITADFMDKSDKLSQESTEKFNLPITSNKKIIQTTKFLFWDPNKDVLKDVSQINDYNLVSINDLKEHITLLKGRMPKDSGEQDGVQEVLVHKNVYNKDNLELDKVYKTTLDESVGKLVQRLNNTQYSNVNFKIVGIYDIKESDFWIKGEWSPGKGEWSPGKEFLLTNIENHKNILKIMPDRYEYINEYNLDYSKLRYSQVNSKVTNNLVNIFKGNEADVRNNKGTMLWDLDGMFKAIEGKMASTASMMIIILMPLIFMLILYILMISKIIANNDVNEISLLKSRGAKLYQIFTTYIVQGIFMGIIGIIVAPIVAKYIVRVMGSTTGFLSFGNETDLIFYVTPFEYLLSIFVIIIFIIALLIPVYITSKKTIVELKRERFRVSKTSLWKKYGVDIIILAFSIYCFYNFIIKEYSETSGSMAKDPFMYLIISGMCLGITLLFLRVYPFIISFIFKITKKLLNPETYYILLYSARNSAKKEYIMIFLIFTLSIGIFNMNSARKINREGENNIEYINGADVVTTQLFGREETAFDKDYKKYKEVEGIENTAKVLTKLEVKINNNDKKEKLGRFIGVNSYEFGKVAWMRDDLFPIDWINYLNNLALEPTGILISNSLVKEGFKVGDTIKLYVPDGLVFTEDSIIYTVEYRIVGSFNYWPTWNPKEKDQQFLIVGDLDYFIENTLPLKYDVWLKLKEGKKSEDIFQALVNKGIVCEKFQANEKLVGDFKKDIFIRTINGTYTFAFVITMLVTFTGFVVYWVLSMKERELQFGIIRALGLSKKRVYRMIFIEQVIFTVVPLAVGTIIGTKMFEVFAPITNEPTIQGRIQLPILLQYMASDYVRIFCIVGVMTVVVLILLITYIFKLKINQAVKLGED